MESDITETFTREEALIVGTAIIEKLARVCDYQGTPAFAGPAKSLKKKAKKLMAASDVAAAMAA